MSSRFRLAVALAAFAAPPATPSVGHAQAPAWVAAVDAALSHSGALQPGGVYKYGLPRSDLHVNIGDVQLKPALALGSWVAFLPVGDGRTMAMGDLVLTEDEIGPVMRSLREGHIDVTAVHNHLRHESPHVMYMHFMGMGDPQTIARTLRGALALSATPLTAAPAAAAAAPSTPLAFELDTSSIAKTLGHAGKVNGGVYQIAIARREVVRLEGQLIPPSMGVATAINIQPAGGGRAVATGDFVLLGTEVKPVIAALEAGAIEVTALHSHMIGESPRLFFMHFWANGDAGTIARALRSAIDLTNSQ